MKRFKFRLQRVLEVRERFRDELRQELVRRNGLLDGATQHLDYLQAQAATSRISEGGTYPASHMFLVAGYEIRLKLEIEQQLLKIEELTQAVNEARERYIAASKDVRALEILKEKRQTEYTEEMLKEEGRVLDELAVQRQYGFNIEND